MKTSIIVPILSGLAMTLCAQMPASNTNADPIVAQSEMCIEAPEGLIAWWRAESNAWDSVGGFDGQYLPYVYNWAYTTGRVGSAFYFTQGTYMRAPAATVLNAGDADGFTVEGWINRDAIQYATILEWSDGVRVQGARLTTGGNQTTALQARFMATNVIPYRYVTIQSAPGVLTNQTWQHVALTFDKASGMAAIYCDGVSVVQTNLGGLLPAIVGELYLGGSFGQGRFVGAIDEFSLYNRALTPVEIQSIYVAGGDGKCLPLPKTCAPLPAGAVAWWPGESNTWDVVGANDLVVYPPVPYYPSYTNGFVDTAFSFVTPYRLTALPSAELNVGLGQGLTFETWIYRSVTAIGGICGWGGSVPGVVLTPPETRLGVRLSIRSDGNLEALIIKTNGQQNLLIAPSPVVGLNRWQHIAMTCDTTTGEVMIYVDGQVEAQRNVGTGPLQTAGIFGVGHASGLQFHGLMDEPTLYSRPLSGGEIRSIYQAGTGGKCSPAPICTIQEGDIAGWWRGESNALDSVSVNHGQTWPLYIPLTIGYTNGRHGAAFALRAGNYIVVSNPPSLNVGEGPGLTLEAWINPINSTYAVFEWHSGTLSPQDATQGVYLSTSPTRGPAYLEANLIDDQGQAHVVLSPFIAPLVNQWRHLAVTYDKASGEAALYVDGSAVTQTNLGSFTPRTTGNLYLGYRPPGQYPGAGARLNGFMDEVTVYRRALTATELRCSQRNGPAGKYPPSADCVAPAEGIVSWWRGESNALDSMRDNHGLPFPSRDGNYTHGKIGAAFRTGIEGNLSHYVIFPSLGGVNSRTAQGFTIEAWVRPNARTPGTALLVNNSTELSLDYNFGGSDTLRATFWSDHGPTRFLYTPSSLMGTGQWHHVAVTYDSSSGWASLHVNGVIAAGTNFGTFTPAYPTSLAIGAGSAGYFNGAVDEVALYDRALGSFEIHSIYSAQNGRCTEPPMITKQPKSMRVNAGSDVTLSVEATGNPLLRYRWFRNGQLIFVNQSVATESLLELTSVTESDRGTYHVVVTNAFGSAVSSNAVLLVNYPPVSVAGAARASVVLPPCTNAVVVVFDGSQSSDPDGDLLNYRWFETGSSEFVATGVVAVVNLAAGMHEFELVVDDGLLTATNHVTVEVLTLVQALKRLIGEVVDSDWNKKQPLLASLNAAFGSNARGQFIPVINQLEAFEQKARAQVAPEHAALAASLREQARAIITAILACDPHPGKKHGKVKAEHCDGKVKMEFEASNAGVFIIEASCDMIQWERIGVAGEIDAGRFGFEDANAWRYPCRFYRIVTP